MANAPSQRTTTYEGTPQPITGHDLPIKLERPDDHCLRISDRYLQCEMNGEHTLTSLVLKCALPKNQQNQSGTCVNSVDIVKAECSTAIEVKSEPEYVSSARVEAKNASDQSYEEEDYKIEDVLLTSRPEQFKECQHEIEKFSFAITTLQTCLSCKRDNCKQHIPHRAWKTESSCLQIEELMKLEIDEHALKESIAFKSIDNEVIRCKQNIKEEEEIGDPAASRSKYHETKNVDRLPDQQTDEHDDGERSEKETKAELGSDAANLPLNNPQLYHCASCEYNAPKKYYLLRHVRRMHNRDKDVEIHHCTACKYSTECLSKFARHQISHHNVGTDTLKCDSCEFTTRSLTYLRTHKRRKHNPDAKLYHCSECPYKTKCSTKLHRHAEVKHNPNAQVHRCAECRYESKYDLWTHTQKQHNPAADLYVCCKCPFSTRYKAHLAKHARLKHDPHAVTYKCTQCAFMTKYEKHLSRHVRVKHNPEVAAYRCSMCPFTTKHKKHLATHVRVQHELGSNSRVYKCDKCGYASTDKAKWRVHTEAKHNPEAEVYGCAECEFTTKYRTHLNRHARIKHDPDARVYACSHCAFKSKWRNSLAAHQKASHGLVEDGDNT